MPSRIEDYALIGDCETCALVGKDGSIDWLCVPRFDSGACFAALLGTPDHGRWLLAPAGDGVRNVRRRYRPGTLILETTFETDGGAATGGLAGSGVAARRSIRGWPAVGLRVKCKTCCGIRPSSASRSGSVTASRTPSTAPKSGK